MECIIYMYTVSLDYFSVIQSKLDRIEMEVLEVNVAFFVSVLVIRHLTTNKTMVLYRN